jgi:hypothetical protein
MIADSEGFIVSEHAKPFLLIPEYRVNSRRYTVTFFGSNARNV